MTNQDFTAHGAAPKVSFVSLGCPKALVDSERIITRLRAEGYELARDHRGADLVVVNTCGFLDSAQAESLSAIGKALNENGKVIVTGCMGAEAETITRAYPGVLAVTRKTARFHGVEDRLTTAAGDLLKADFGANHNIATIGHILHSEGIERSRRLLKKTFAALAPGGTVAIAEFLPNEKRTGPPTPLIFAVNMLIHTEVGDTYTFGEIAGWLREAGFVKPRLLEAPSPSPLILATRPR
jgi:hypothetical protein